MYAYVHRTLECIRAEYMYVPPVHLLVHAPRPTPQRHSESIRIPSSSVIQPVHRTGMKDILDQKSMEGREGVGISSVAMKCFNESWSSIGVSFTVRC